MKSKTKVTLSIVITILVSIVFIFALYNRINPKEKNIFDEMYYGEKKYIVGQKILHFGKYQGYINGIEKI